MADVPAEAGIAVSCDRQGMILEVLHDGLGLDRLQPGRPLTATLDPGSIGKALNFLETLRRRGKAFDWELNVQHRDGVEALHFVGFDHSDRLLLVASASHDATRRLVDELLAMNTEHTNRLRAVLKEHDELRRQRDDKNAAMFDELTRLNNELADAHRRLAKQHAELEAAHRRIRELMHTDDLTGLANRRHASERLDQELERSRRHGHPLSVALCDLDHFKSINDRFGHQAGDETLKRFAAVLNRQLRPGDLAARFGGEEFLLILPHADPAGAYSLIERIRRAFAEAGTQGNRATASFGVASAATDDSADDLLRRADRALYAAKEAGRNCTVRAGRQQADA